MAAKCSSFRCFNCEAPEHRIEDCQSPTLCSICLEKDHDVSVCPFLLYSANVVNKSGGSLNPDDVETISDPASSPAALPSYAKVVSRTPEQAEAIKAVEAVRSVSKQPSSKSSKDSKDSVKQQPKKPPKPKAASEPPPSSVQKPSSDHKRTTQEKAERERHRHHHNHDRESSEEDSDHEFVKVRDRRHSRR